MRVLVKQNKYDSTYDVEVLNATKEETLKLRAAVDKLQELTEEPVRIGFEDPTTWSKEKLNNLCLCITWYEQNQETKNKISTIKFLCTITNLALKDAKDLVEYQLYAQPMPSWVAEIFNIKKGGI